MFHLFRKNIEKCCAYCEQATAISETQVGCARKGVVDSAGHCRHFCYDPLKRVPPRPVTIDESKHSAEEFSL